MNQSRYFGKSFRLVEMPCDVEGYYRILLGDSPGNEALSPGGGPEEMKEVVAGLIDTLRVTRKILKEFARAKGLKVGDPNEYHRNIVGLAKKIGESPDNVRVISDAIISELFQEMTTPKKKS